MDTDVDLVGLLRSFLIQANESKSLSVNHYPTQHRGLRMKVSFGKGTPARVPWIGFFGPGHTPAQGCYPAVLYFKAASALVVAYGVSETYAAQPVWQDLFPLETTDSFMATHFGRAPERYGNSFVAEAYRVDQALDLTNAATSVDKVIDSYKMLLAQAGPKVSHLDRFGRRT